MPRKSLLTPAERSDLMSPPATEEELVRHYSFSERDLSLIRQRRGDANRLGFAVQLCLLRFPGRGLEAGMEVSDTVIQWVGRQLRIDTSCWLSYASRAQTRREHLVELRSWLELTPFKLSDFRRSRSFLCALAMRTDKGTLLAAKAMEEWRRLKVAAPPVEVLDRLCASSITEANQRVCALLADSLSTAQQERLGRVAEGETGHPSDVDHLAAPVTSEAQFAPDDGAH